MFDGQEGTEATSALRYDDEGGRVMRLSIGGRVVVVVTTVVVVVAGLIVFDFDLVRDCKLFVIVIVFVKDWREAVIVLVDVLEIE